METFHFNIHDIVRGKVTGPAWLMAPVSFELDFFRDLAPPQDDSLDLIVSFGRLGDDFDQSINYGPDPLEWNGKHLIGKWRCRMSRPGAMAPAVLCFRGNVASRFIVQKWIVEPAIRLAAENKGAVMTHAAALSDGTKAMLVAGPGGAGKTSWTLKWLEADHPYLSDDFSICYNEKLMPYVTPMRLGARNIFSEKVLENIGLANKAQIVLRTMLRRVSLGSLKMYFKIMPQLAIPGLKISEPIPLAGAVLLDIETKEKRSALTPEAMADLQVKVDLDEFHGFGGPHLLTPDLIQAHRANLLNLLTPLPCLRVPARRFPPREALGSIDEFLAWGGAK